MISAATITAIKDATNLADLVAEYTPLRRISGGFICKCVFHTERTASMHVHSEGERKNYFHCFGCSASGNCFGFIMQIEGYTFFKAAEYLADRAGIKIMTGKRLSALQRMAATEDRACSKWWWQVRWNRVRQSLDEVSDAESPAIQIIRSDDGTCKVIGAPIPDDYAFADCLGRILRWIEGLPAIERLSLFRSTVSSEERRQWRAEVAEEKAFAAAWMGLAEKEPDEQVAFLRRGKAEATA